MAEFILVGFLGLCLGYLIGVLDGSRIAKKAFNEAIDNSQRRYRD